MKTRMMRLSNDIGDTGWLKWELGGVWRCIGAGGIFSRFRAILAGMPEGEIRRLMQKLGYRWKWD